MKKYLLSLLIITGMFILTCGNEPPEQFFEGTPEDSTAITDLLVTNADLTQTSDLYAGLYTSLVLGTVHYPAADSYFKADSIVIKQHVDSCALTFGALNRFTDLWWARDTTCTVYLWDTFTVISDVHFDKIYKGYYFYPPGDTTTALDTTMEIDSVGYNTKDISGEGLRHIFFEPVREPGVDENGDSVMVVKEPREWVLKRISYGSYYYPNRGAEYPAISNIILTPRTSAVPETIYAAQPDTFEHHAMDRFRAFDSLLTYTAGETLDVAITVTGIGYDTVAFFASCAGSDRVSLTNGSGALLVSGSDIVNLYFEVVNNNGYYYLKPDKGYVATIWLIPVRVQ